MTYQGAAAYGYGLTTYSSASSRSTASAWAAVLLGLQAGPVLLLFMAGLAASSVDDPFRSDQDLSFIRSVGVGTALIAAVMFVMMFISGICIAKRHVSGRILALVTESICLVGLLILAFEGASRSTETYGESRRASPYLMPLLLSILPVAVMILVTRPSAVDD
jgi:hypothetical protein